jgi:glucose-6-phosphate 1-dehydrogenase
MVSRVIPVDPFDLVIFGGTGDLARRKILPALFRRFCDGQMPREARIIGAARTRQSAGDWAGWVGEALEEFVPERLREPQSVAEFLERLDYLAVDAKGDDGWSDLCDRMRPDAVQAFYFSVAPSLFGDLAERLHQFKIARPDARIVVEKPFGNDLASAKALNGRCRPFRRDADLPDRPLPRQGDGAEPDGVRFGNVLFEPLWNTQYVDHVQITVAEEVGVGGRGAYYDQSGAMRDMVQNHLMQLLCLTAMEPPSRFEPDAVRDEKLKVIRALDPVGARRTSCAGNTRGRKRGLPTSTMPRTPRAVPRASSR